MGLIKCPDCGKSISSRAFQCPFCGCPSEYFDEAETIEKKQSTKNPVNSEKKDKPENRKKESKNKDLPSKDAAMENQVVKSFTICGGKIVFNKKQDEYIALRKPFELIANECKAAMLRLYNSTTDVGGLVQQASDIMNQTLSKLVDSMSEMCYSSGKVFSMEDFYEKYYCSDLDYNTYIDGIVEKYANIMSEKAQLANYREMQKASRGRWVGGGFGVKGAIKGAVTASIMNAGTDFIRSFGDSSRESNDNAVIRQKIRQLHDSDYCRNQIVYGAYRVIIEFFECYLQEMYPKTNSWAYCIANERDAKSLLEVSSKFESDPQKAVSNYASVISKYPYYEHIYAVVYKAIDKDEGMGDYDSLYYLLDYLGMSHPVISREFPERNDVGLNVKMATFFNNSSVLKDLDYSSYSAELYYSVKEEEKKLLSELGVSEVGAPMSVFRYTKLYRYLSTASSKLNPEQLLEVQTDKDEDILNMKDYVHNLFQKAADSRMLEYAVLNVPGTAYKQYKYDMQWVNDKCMKYINEYPLIAYDSSLMATGGAGFALGETKFFVLETKQVIPLKVIKKIAYNPSGSIWMITIESGEVQIPCKFSRLEREDWGYWGTTIAALLQKIFDHYHYLFDQTQSVDKGNTDVKSNEAIKIRYIIKKVRDEMTKCGDYLSYGSAIRLLDMLYSEIKEAGIDINKENVENVDPAEWNSIREEYFAFEKELTDLALKCGDYTFKTLDEARIYRDATSGSDFTSIIDATTFLPKLLYIKEKMLKIESEKVDEELEYLNKKIEEIDKYSRTKPGRFEMKLRYRLMKEYPLEEDDAKDLEFACTPYFTNSMYGYLDDEPRKIDELNFDDDEHTILQQTYGASLNFAITNKRVICEMKPTFSNMMDETFVEGALDSVYIKDLDSVKGKSGVVGAQWVTFKTTNKKIVGYVSTDAVKLAKCINDALEYMRGSSFDGNLFRIPAEYKEVDKTTEPVQQIAATSSVDNPLDSKLEENVEAANSSEVEKTDESKICPNCGKKLKPNVKFCNFCGSELSADKQCIHCGKTIMKEAKFCNFCGKVQNQ